MSETGYFKAACVHCENALEIPLEGAGMTLQCPHCGESGVFEPSRDEEAEEAAGPPIVEVLAGFQGAIRPPPFRPWHFCGLLLTAMMMVMLPVIYAGIIGGVAWGVYYYATRFTFLLTLVSPGFAWFVVVLLGYVTPLASGVTVVLFMFKPLFARRAPRARALAINPGAEPALYAFIARICETVHAPLPARIDIDCQLNAAAGFTEGAGGLIGGKLVLIIGLPLMAGLTVAQFAGVVAHEFGHFSQGSGMRLGYFIRRINDWFVRVVYVRDAWDLGLERMLCEENNGYVTVSLLCVQAAVGFTRLVLKGLMYLGFAVSCFLQRQREFDADHYQIELTGSENFESMSRRAHVLGVVLGHAYSEMQKNWKAKGTLPANFPRYLLEWDSALNPESRTQIEDTMGLDATRMFDTHPSNGDRIRHARQANAPGIFACDLPATILWNNFDVPARQVTALHYQDDLGLRVNLAKTATMMG